MFNNQIDYSHLTHEELLSLVTLKFNPEQLTRDDCENLSHIYIDFSDVSEMDLLNAVISSSFDTISDDSESFEEELVDNHLFDNAPEINYEKDRSKRRINRKMRRKHHPIETNPFKIDWLWCKLMNKSEFPVYMYASPERDAQKDFEDQMSLLYD